MIIYIDLYHWIDCPKEGDVCGVICDGALLPFHVGYFAWRFGQCKSGWTRVPGVSNFCYPVPTPTRGKMIRTSGERPDHCVVLNSQRILRRAFRNIFRIAIISIFGDFRSKWKVVCCKLKFITMVWEFIRIFMKTSAHYEEGYKKPFKCEICHKTFKSSSFAKKRRKDF